MDLFFKIPFWGFQWKFTFHIFVEFRQRAALNYNYIAEIWHKIALETVHDSNSDLSLPQLTWQSYLCQVTQGSQAKLSSLACGFLVNQKCLVTFFVNLTFYYSDVVFLNYETTVQCYKPYLWVTYNLCNNIYRLF